MVKKKKKTSLGSRRRTKGHNYERQIAQDYRDLGYTAERAIQSRGAEKCDVNVAELPFWIECECAIKPSAFRKLQQAQRDRKEGQPIVLHLKKACGKGTKAEEVVVLEKEYWYQILEALHTECVGVIGIPGDPER